MALLFGCLWRLLLVLFHVNRATVSWLRVRLRSLKGRLLEWAAAAGLLSARFTGHQKKSKRSSDAGAGAGAGAAPEVNGYPADSQRAQWLLDGKSLEKLPVHIGLLVAEEEPSYTDIANLVVWCMAVGISYVSVYDNHGNGCSFICQAV